MDSRSAWAYLLWLAVQAGVVGCQAPAPLYAPTTGGYASASISAKETWTVAGGVEEPQAAIDGDLETTARTGQAQAAAELTIDLKRACLFQTVILEHGNDQNGYCRRVAVATSVDGKAFVERYQAPGTRRVTILSLPEPVLARYVRLRVVRPGEQRWCVAEVFLQ